MMGRGLIFFLLGGRGLVLVAGAPAGHMSVIAYPFVLVLGGSAPAADGGWCDLCAVGGG